MSTKEKKVVEFDVHFTADKSYSHKYEGETGVEGMFMNINKEGNVGIWLNKKIEKLPDQIVVNIHHGIGEKADKAKVKSKLKKNKNK